MQDLVYMDVRYIFFLLGVVGFAKKKVWKKNVPLKVCFFVWCLIRGRVLTHDNLCRRGIITISQCCFCRRSSETIQHLFLECTFVKEIWNYFWGCMAQQWNCNTVEQVLHRNGSEELSNTGKIYWEVLNHAVLWVIWNERNKRIFEEEKMDTWNLINKVKECLWSWCMQEVQNTRIEDVIFQFARIVRIVE